MVSKCSSSRKPARGWSPALPALPALILMAGLAGPPAPAADPSPGPRDLVDIEEIKALDLAALGWQEDLRKEEDGVLVIGGSWRGPHFIGFDNQLRPLEMDLGEYATVYVPTRAARGGQVLQMVWAAHYESMARGIYQEFLELARALPLAFVVHGEKPSDWISHGFESRDSLVGMGILALTLFNQCEPRDYRTGNFLLALAETNLRALTLLSRLLEAEGYLPGPAGIFGFSKEGFAAWFASAVDDRLIAAAPGGWHLEDIVAGLTAEEENWGCEGSIGGAVSGTLLFGFREWLRGSRGGQQALEYFSVDRFAGKLYPEFLLIHGDVGLIDLHDGVYYTPGAESRFLENFTAKPFRYDRQSDRQLRESEAERNGRLTRILARRLVEGDAAAHPKVEDAQVSVEAGRFQVRARLAGEVGAARLFWSRSSNRAFDDEGNAPWIPVPLERPYDLWLSPWIEIPEGEAVGWYVEAERTVAWEGFDLVLRDASPQRFFGLPPALECPGVPVPDCLEFRRGDSNGDGSVNLPDAVHILGFLFWGQPQALSCEDASDLDDDGILAITDAIYLLNYLFLGGTKPREPEKSCGLDPTGESLGCREYSPCNG